MNKITFPLKTQMKGADVGDLQDAMQLLLNRGIILKDDEAARKELSAALKPERAEQAFGKATQKLVSVFQELRHLESSGAVDGPTAEALNAVLEELGAFSPAAPDQHRLVGGQVRREDGLPLQGVRVRVVHEAAAGSLRLGEDTTDAEGRYTIRYESLPGMDGINLRVTVFDADGKPLHDSDVIRGAKPLEIVDLIVPGVDIKPYRVEGKVASRVSASVGGLRVVMVDKGVGGDVQLAQATTDDGGAFQATFSDSDVRRRGKAQPDLQARVFAGDAFLGASDVHYNASQHETLNVLLDDKAAPALRSEHEVLTSALANHFKGKLGDLKETDERQDITYLANKTGWDARAVALAALADQFSARTIDATAAPAIPQAFFYALFRAGLPANENTLYHADAKTLEAAWKKAAEQGVIPKASADQIPNLVERFQALSAQKLLTGPALVGASSLKEMLTISRLNDAQQATFAQLYAAKRADMPALWEAVGNALGKDMENRLRVDGKLGFLTINNAPLMQKVHTTAGANGLSDPLELAQMGYHRAEPWSQLLTPDVPIPKEIPGDTPETKRANYANYLAAQVRLSYPTAAVAQMVKSGELPLTGAANGVSDQVHAFLTEHQGKFEIGVQPVQQYIAQNNLQVADETVRQVKRLQRVYQITPSDPALTGLMKRGIDAAYHVVRYNKETFVQSFAADLGGADNAALTYDRSVQIHNAVLNIALSYLNARTAPAIGVHSPSGSLDPTPANVGDVIAYATLESLFGSMDFCACDHCRSILSPAAYLVDLLLFLQSDPDVWADFLKTWRQNHANAPYPFVDQNAWKKFQDDWNIQHPGQLLPDTQISPFDVLMSRRPDIQHLPLTCGNTNTALPYIDVVNETLEYFIANNSQKLSLKDYHGQDTNGAASEDLLASPQFVIDSAYTTLRGERFPAPLPFHQPLENLRRYFNKFEVPLPLAMERLRRNDALERGANPYGWRDILMEEIGLSRDEYEILTASKAVPLWRMYGFPDGTADADVIAGIPNIAGLSNAKQFTRRVGITYEDLVSALKTRFINPNSDLIPKLERLGVDFAMLAELKTKNDTLTDAKFDALLAALAVPPDPVEYGGDIKAWVKQPDNYARIMGLITLAIPAGNWTPAKAYAIGDCVRPTAVLSESTLYYECTTPGTSAASMHKWPTTPGNTCSDGTVAWTCRDASSCLSFDNLAFRYADPAQITQNISAAEFVRLLRFIRLWKKLGWTIEQTDAAICALYRTDLAPIAAGDVVTVSNLNKGFLILLPRLGIVMQVMHALNLTPNGDLLSLLACVAPIGIHDGVAWLGNNEGGFQQRTIPSLYRQLFLNPALLKQDPVFDDNGYGEFLQKVDVDYTHSTLTLGAAITAADSKIAYDNVNHRLSYYGNLDATHRNALKNITGVSLLFQQAVDALYAKQRLFLHSEALRSAFNLTGDEYERIVTDPDLHYDADTPLTIPNITAIFRRGWLARKLKLSVRELLLLTQLTGLDPFSAPNLTNPAILRLIELVQSMKDRSFKSAAALYLIWNQDLSGKSAPAPVQLSELARTLRGDFASIDDQFAAIEDPNGDVARARMTLVYGQETSDAFFTLLDDTLVVDVAYTQTSDTLDNAIIAADPRITYDNFRHRLSHMGLVTTAMQTALRNVTGVSPNFRRAVDALFARSEDTKGSFFTRNPELKPIYDKVLALDSALVLAVDYTHSAQTLQAAITAADNRIQYDNTNHRLSYSGVLTAARRDVLKRVSGVTLEFQSAVDALFALSQGSRGAVVLATLQPELSRRRKRQQALQRLGAAAGVDPALTQTLLNPAAGPYPLHAAGYQDRPALDDVLALETPGLAAQFFFRDTATGTVDQSVPAAANLAYASGGRNPLPNPGNAISGIWSGQVETPEAGFYNFIIEADSGSTVTLTRDGQALALTQNGNVWRNTDPFELKAGMLYKIELKVEKVKDALSLKWETPKRAREVIPSRYLYPPSVFAPFSSAYVRFLKTASLAAGLGLTANEMTHFATYSDYQINGDGWLNTLPVNGNSAAPTTLLKPLQALLDYARIKADLAPDDERLLTVLKNPVAATADRNGPLYTLTRWDAASLTALLNQFGRNIADLAHLEWFGRVYDAFALIRKMGISGSGLIAATTNEPAGNTVRDLQAALRARYDTAAWWDVVQPINDEMRSLQRDALVAYILHQMRSHPENAHIDTPDKLFEYFLMDVQMDPCMQTSRIRHALSSVQLFIERCLMNLEPRVSPAVINPKQWEWMKRYRVWEANRKVYLFPENWLEPELRDDKSPFFKEIESELLQSDITEDSATTALLNYLSKLEEVAKLEPCGIYHVERNEALRTGEIDHVVARTAGAHRKYYYRRREGTTWTPWEQIKLDIEDNPVIPVVWNGRLLLFWLRILKQTPATAMQIPSGKLSAGMDISSVVNLDAMKVSVQAVLCWSEYYNGKWQPTKTSDVNAPTGLDSYPPAGESAFDRSQLVLGAWAENDALRVGISGDLSSSSFLVYNTHTVPVREVDAPVVARPPVPTRIFTQYVDKLTIWYFKGMGQDETPCDVLQAQIAFRTVEPPQLLQNGTNAPFFYEDSHHVFFVTTEEPQMRIENHPGLGVSVNPGIKFAVEIPPLILRADPHKEVGPKFWGDGGPVGPAPGVVDPAPMQRFLSEDAYIRQGIGTTGVVTFGDKQIGPSGAMSIASK